MLSDNILDVIVQERIIFIMGAKDTGKTAFVTALANELFHRGYSTGIIDADIGQSDIGPPATVGFGCVETSLKHLRDAALRHLYFVGSTTPKGHLLPLVIGTRKMLDKALECGMQKILIDTTGLVSGHIGRILKEQKINLIQPDAIICLQKGQECEHILKAYSPFNKPVILRCTPNSQCRKKSLAERQKNRAILFKDYFSQAHEISCSLTQIGIFGSRLFSGKPVSSSALQQLSQLLCMTDETSLPSSAVKSKNLLPETRIVWGEYWGKELHLVTSKKLRREHLLKLKHACPGIVYIKNSIINDLHNLLVGILNKDKECFAIGILRSIDFQTKRAVVFTSAVPQEIGGLTLSTYSMEITR